MSNDVKDWKSFEEQVKLLQERGMLIDDEELSHHFLQRVGYYRLSGYWFPFKEGHNEKQDHFIEGTCFSDITKLYNFDRKLRLLALDAIERIELAMQVEIAHLLGKRDPFAHMKPDYLHGNFLRTQKNGKPSKHSQWLQDYNRLVRNSKRKAFVQHNLERYGKLPIWVAIEIFDFGTMSKLYAGMMHKDKLSIETRFGLHKGNEFQTWLKSFNFIRNTAAHHSRLWNCNILELASIPRNKIKLAQLKNSRPFLYFCMMQYILKIICPHSKWGERFIALIEEFPQPENKAIRLHDMGIVSQDGKEIVDWKDWGIWK